MKPVYIINGFLGSGKTEFINFTLDQPYFQSSGKTLLLLCEEGEEEYDPYVLKRSKTIVETIEEEADFTPEKMVELEKKYHPERIIIEYNGGSSATCACRGTGRWSSRSQRSMHPPSLCILRI